MPTDSQNLDPAMCCDCGPFFLDMVGRFPRDRIRIVESQATRLSVPEVDAIIEKAWAEALASSRQDGRHLYNGRLHRLIEFSCRQGVLTLTVGATCFKDFWGTNLTHAHLRHRHGQEVMADVLGVSAAVCTSDGFVMLGRRSGMVAVHAGRIHAVGGVMESAGPGEPAPHPSAAIARELHEEIGIEPGDIASNICIGMVRDRHIVQPEMIFDVRVNVDSAGLRRFQPAPDNMEHTDLVAVRDHPSAVVTFMQQHYSDLTPVAQATLLLHGLVQWGSGWFASTRGYLRGVV